jgi:hypothetical protein
LRDVVDGDRKLAPLRSQPLVGQPVAPQQQTDDTSEDRDEREQDMFAQAPSRNRDVSRNHRRQQHAANGNRSDDPGVIGRTGPGN